jgi:hypothetical protein
MGMFRKLPVEVRAHRILLPCVIDTLEGSMEAKLGDWLITGVAGEQYPCKDDIFRQTYEPVDDDAKLQWQSE